MNKLYACDYMLNLSSPRVGQAHCASCDLKENLWLCLTCGALGCGRAQYGGIGGNGHALNHYEATKHPVSVKLGTITPEGGAGKRTLHGVWLMLTALL